MASLHSAMIAERFGACASDYERRADLQRAVAARLAQFLPDLPHPRVLEIGCGTGLFSRHLLARYPAGEFLFTDIAPEMLVLAKQSLGGSSKVQFAVMDGEHPSEQGPFDLICLSMTLHWFADPITALERLRGLLAPTGQLLYASIGPASFSEWAATLATLDLPNGLVRLPDLPGLFEEKQLVPDSSALAFLRRIKAVGGATPRAGYTALSPGALRRAIRAADTQHGGRITWQIVYGRLSASG